jgi:hypothetical protein
VLGELGGAAIGAAFRGYAGRTHVDAMRPRLVLEQRGGVLLGGDLGSIQYQWYRNTGSTRLRVAPLGL